jgi:hypothetical protein
VSPSPGMITALYAANREYVEGEARWTVQRYARSPADEAHLLDVLGLTGASSGWNRARVAFVIIERCRGGYEFTASTLQLWVPDRAWPLVAAAIAWLQAEDMIGRTGRTVRSDAPGARGRKIPCWRLTVHGERLSREISPIPGMIPVITDIARAAA